MKPSRLCASFLASATLALTTIGTSAAEETKKPPPPPVLQVGETMRPLDVTNPKAVKACTGSHGTVSKDKLGHDVCVTKTGAAVKPQPLNPQPLPPGYRQPDAQGKGIIIDDKRGKQ